MEVKIPKEIREYQESIFFGLSARQFLCSLLAVGAAVGLYFLLRPMREDGLDPFRREYNGMLLSKVTGANNSVARDRYLTVSVVKRSVEEAWTYFSRVGPGLPPAWPSFPTSPTWPPDAGSSAARGTSSPSRTASRGIPSCTGL